MRKLILEVVVVFGVPQLSPHCNLRGDPLEKGGDEPSAQEKTLPEMNRKGYAGSGLPQGPFFGKQFPPPLNWVKSGLS